MPDPIRIRAQGKDGVTEVHVLMPHPMESGFRKDESGTPIAAHFIAEVEIKLDERVVLAATLGRGVSQDPLLHFRFKGGRPGDNLTVTWTDNRGERRNDQHPLSGVI